jgi:hypothetical protein
MLCGLQNLLTDGGRRTDGNFVFSSKNTFISIERSKTSIKKFGFSVHEINTFITKVNRKKMCCVSARRLPIHKNYNKFKNKFAE